MWIWVHKCSDYTDTNISDVFFETKEDAWEHFLYDWDQVREEWNEKGWSDGYNKEDSRGWETVEFHQLKQFKGLPAE